MLQTRINLLKTAINTVFNQRTRLSSSVTHNQPSDYKIIYKLPYVRQIALINRMKVYQTALSSVAVPTSFILTQLQLCSDEVLPFTAVLAIGGLVPLYGLGYFSNKLIGIIYVNSSLDRVKVAYIDFWGRRKDVEMPVNDIVPISELATRSITDGLYFKFKRFSNEKDYLKLCVKYGIVDTEKFNKVTY